MTLVAQHAPRVLALWERPQFVWKVQPGLTDPLPLLKAMAAIPDVQRLGLLRVPSQQMALHPPQTLDRIDHPMNELIKGHDTANAMPCLMHWSVEKPLSSES